MGKPSTEEQGTQTWWVWQQARRSFISLGVISGRPADNGSTGASRQVVWQAWTGPGGGGATEMTPHASSNVLFSEMWFCVFSIDPEINSGISREQVMSYSFTRWGSWPRPRSQAHGSWSHALFSASILASVGDIIASFYSTVPKMIWLSWKIDPNVFFPC